MELDLGGQETIESPTAEDVRCYLRVPPPFVILSDTTGFMQAIRSGSEYQVEYRVNNGQHQYYCLVDYQTACELFLDFHSGSTNYQASAEWKRLRVWDGTIPPFVVVILCLLGLLILSGALWLALL